MRRSPFTMMPTTRGSAAQLSRMPRLICLITEVKTNPRQTPAQLQRTLGISRAQFFEDKRLLEKAFGFKVQFNRAKRSYEILEDPYLPIVDLKLSEAFALILAVRQLSASGDYILTYEAIGGIKKIVASAQPELRGFLQNVLDETVLREGFGCEASILESLRQACVDHLHLIITYEHYDQQTIERHVIDPYQLFFKRRALYLDAYDKGEQALRMFRVNRIKTVEKLGASGMLVTDYSFARRFRDTFSTDGGLLYEVGVSYPKEVAWWAMSWGSEAEVLEPPELREYVADEVRKLAALYGK
jgi:predicted DNA-binding transcriptional regulator YafY